MAQDRSTDAVPVMQWYASPSLPHFSGDAADGPADDFVAEVDRVLAVYPMSDEMAAYFIISHLTGIAHREVTLYTLEETDTPEKVTGILLGVFGDKRRITTLMKVFFNRDQQPKESLLDYSHAVRSLERSIRRKKPEILPDDIVRDKFIDGLVDPTLRRDLRRLVRRNPLTSFCQARDCALRLAQEMEEDQRQHEETEPLRNELSLLKECVNDMQESLSELCRSRVTQKGRVMGEGYRRKRCTRNQPPTSKTSSLRGGSNQHCDSQQLLRKEDMSSTHTRLACDDEESGDGWVLLPIPSDPGTNRGPSRKESDRVSQEESPAVEAVRPHRSPISRLARLHEAGTSLTESHPKTAPDRVRKPLHLVYDKGRAEQRIGKVLPTCRVEVVHTKPVPPPRNPLRKSVRLAQRQNPESQ
eukprot:TRINITY_DN729_c0_g1_i4.p1 TRINITY_DN729_c0_g1~~TRINITY_DN729_c0_g1_i4.p1  ORF type:complete len:414 (+),score=73.91 TRINITY_DN729_c0_g1_i4:490-1731(+)